jgi:hypothetical protein
MSFDELKQAYNKMGYILEYKPVKTKDYLEFQDCLLTGKEFTKYGFRLRRKGIFKRWSKFYNKEFIEGGLRDLMGMNDI